MAKRGSKRISKQEEIAAKAAIEEIEREVSGHEEFESPEARDLSFALTENNSLTDQEVDERDIFSEAKRKALARNTTAQFRIYKDGAWLGTKQSNYTWEKLRADNKSGGHFKVVAVDRDNQFIGSQSLEVAGIEDEPHNQAPVQESRTNLLEMLELMKENQREAEAKSQSQQTGLASVMASMVQMQTQSTQMMMQMFQKSSEQTQNLMIAMMNKNSESKGPDPMLALVTTLLTQKPKDDGFNAMSVFKMVEDAKRDTRTQAREDAKSIEEKARKYAQEMTPENDGDESLTKTIIKSFGPVIADVMVKKQQADEQAAAVQANQRQLGSRGLNQGFIEDQMNRPAIPAANPQRPRPQVTRTAPAGASVSSQVNPVPDTRPLAPNPVTKGPVDVTPTQELVIDSRLQERIFTMCAGDIGNALMLGASASKTAATCLEKLEKEGISRQTVVAAFKLEDFYDYAEKFSVPDEAKPWLKEFHESIAKQASEKPVRTSADPRIASGDNGSSGNGSKPVIGAVANERSQASRPSAGAQPRERVKDF